MDAARMHDDGSLEIGSCGNAGKRQSIDLCESGVDGAVATPGHRPRRASQAFRRAAAQAKWDAHMAGLEAWRLEMARQVVRLSDAWEGGEIDKDGVREMLDLLDIEDETERRIVIMEATKINRRQTLNARRETASLRAEIERSQSTQCMLM